MIRFGEIGKISLVLAMSAFVVPAVAGCGGDDDDTQGQPNAQTVALNKARLDIGAASANSGATALLNNQTFTVPSSVVASNAQPAAYQTQLKSVPTVDLKFAGVAKDTGTFTITNPAQSGSVKITTVTLTSAAGTITLPFNLFFTGNVTAAYSNVTMQCGVGFQNAGTLVTTLCTNTQTVQCKSIAGNTTSITCKVGTTEITVGPLGPTGTIGTPPVSGSGG